MSNIAASNYDLRRVVLLTNTFFVILNNCEMTDFKGLHDQNRQFQTI